MAQTVIGMFDDAAEAQRAVQQLTNRGFSRDNIDVTNPGSGSLSSTNTDTHHDEESGIGKFFRSLFSDDDSDKYAHVAKRSQSLVTVHTQSSEQAEEAADILDDAGAVNVDERAASYGYTGRNSSNFSADNTIGNSGTTGSYAGRADSLTGTSDRGTGTSGYTGGASDLSGTSDRATGNPGYTTGSDDLAGTTGTNDRTTGTSDLASGSYDRTTDSSDETNRIPIIEENLEVGKREVQTGGTRIRSRIVERPVEESLRLREENVTVERTPVDRAATSADLHNFTEKEIEMTETAEVPVVSKEARVVEEVSLNKEVNERTETVSDTVRRTEVDVEDLGSDTNTNRTGANRSDNSTSGI